MAKAVITLDDKDGQISLSMFLEGGFQADSNAHQHAGLILKHLDELAGMKTEQAVQWVNGTYVPSAEMAVAGLRGLRVLYRRLPSAASLMAVYKCNQPN
ncbi:hypothetical protein LP416_29355 [Polaromonas sp. P2-4]|nr:hypothetical protein LP416_29355 [Polaromonas sp. P2-4]